MPPENKFYAWRVLLVSGKSLYFPSDEWTQEEVECMNFYTDDGELDDPNEMLLVEVEDRG